MVIVLIILCLVHTVGKCACSDGWTGGLCEKSQCHVMCIIHLHVDQHHYTQSKDVNVMILKLAKSCHCVVMYVYVHLTLYYHLPLRLYQFSIPATLLVQNIHNYVGAEVGLSEVDLVLGELTKIHIVSLKQRCCSIALGCIIVSYQNLVYNIISEHVCLIKAW